MQICIIESMPFHTIGIENLKYIIHILYIRIIYEKKCIQKYIYEIYTKKNVYKHKNTKKMYTNIYIYTHEIYHEIYLM